MFNCATNLIIWTEQSNDISGPTFDQTYLMDVIRAQHCKVIFNFCSFIVLYLTFLEKCRWVWPWVLRMSCWWFVCCRYAAKLNHLTERYHRHPIQWFHSWLIWGNLACSTTAASSSSANDNSLEQYNRPLCWLFSYIYVGWVLQSHIDKLTCYQSNCGDLFYCQKKRFCGPLDHNCVFLVQMPSCSCTYKFGYYNEGRMVYLCKSNWNSQFLISRFSLGLSCITWQLLMKQRDLYLIRQWMRLSCHFICSWKTNSWDGLLVTGKSMVVHSWVSEACQRSRDQIAHCLIELYRSSSGWFWNNFT